MKTEIVQCTNCGRILEPVHLCYNCDIKPDLVDNDVNELVQKIAELEIKVGLLEPPGKTKIPQTEEEKRELQIKVMQPFNGWMNYQIVEFLEWLIEWNRRKARESAAEHRRLSL